MASIDIPFVGPSYHLQDWSLDCQRTVNLYVQSIESGTAPQATALLPTAGLKKKFEFDGAIRGLFALTDRCLVVAGQKLYSIDKNSVIKEIGKVEGINQVYFADNSVQVMIVSNYAYSYIIKTGKLSRITNYEFLGASDVTVLDSRFVWTIPKTGRFQYSDLLGTTTSALNYATAESSSDNIVRTTTLGGQLWLIGEKTTEVWSSTGNQDMPFQRMNGATMPVGCIAPRSVCEFGRSLVWLSRTNHGQGQIVITNGYTVERISNHAIETEIASYEYISDAYAFAYQDNGHNFVVMSFPSAKKTWCFDSTTGQWHERSYFNPKIYKHEHHRASAYCFFNGMHLVGDRQYGKVFELTNSSQTDDGALIMRERVTPTLNPNGQNITFDELEIMAQVGQEENTKPLVMLDWSDDKGRTWSSVREHDLGAIGESDKRIIFRRLGRSRGRVFRLRMTDAGRLVLLGAKVKIR